MVEKTRSRTGCLTCRHRKKKCDECRPSCAGCQRNGLECQWEPSASPRIPRRRRGRRAEKTLPGQAQGMLSVFSVLTPDLASRLLRHFLNASPRWLSTRPGPRRTDYMKWLSPALSDSHQVRSCILAIASADLLKYDRGDPQIRHAAIEYYGQAVSSLRIAIEDEMAAPSPEGPRSGTNTSDLSGPRSCILVDHTPLAVLLLCLHETQNFAHRERILPHLNAAAFLLQNRLDGGTDPVMRGYLFEMFCYFFALAVFSLGPKVFIARADRIITSPSVIQHIQHGHIMGTSQYLFLAIYRIALLGHKLSGNPDEASAIELLLLDQELVFCQTHNPKHMDLEHPHDAIVSRLYGLACRIHIRRLLAPSRLDGTHSLVEDFIHNLQHLPPDSPSHNILSWPLVVAGFSTSIPAHQRIIAAKLDNIHEEWQCAVFSKGAEFLREKWRKDRMTRAVPEHVSNTDGLAWQCPVILA
ncbi:hypothetical protein BO78DRAFT_300599 [Aspergillus sclerotiicarbonarius CBS 121057]|uniref:Zn(2)-C6 fungal-type domain-containing protein n=1 Tax=Aspergillus sclerotiicarbonarius (strain CBS 121057 / IBT 28362) TaxID=1448318 RepID=A0A319EQS1_ASPSB|nr:hypothetical protein BO78DRAFT_300599 [Aspergillus sclerotiicarbonarius CBS 121057]